MHGWPKSIRFSDSTQCIHCPTPAPQALACLLVSCAFPQRPCAHAHPCLHDEKAKSARRLRHLRPLPQERSGDARRRVRPRRCVLAARAALGVCHLPRRRRRRRALRLLRALGLLPAALHRCHVHPALAALLSASRTRGHGLFGRRPGRAGVEAASGRAQARPPRAVQRGGRTAGRHSSRRHVPRAALIRVVDAVRSRLAQVRCT